MVTFGLAGDVIDDLLLEHRTAQLDQSIRILPVVVENILLLARELTRALDQHALHFIVAHRDAGSFADRAEHQAQPHAPRGYRLVLLARLLFGRVFVGEGLAFRLHLLGSASSRSR